MKIGMLTSGGDCQGLNAALRGVAKALYQEFGTAVTIYGIRDGYRGLIEGDYHPMEPQDFSDILTRGGTILGTSRQPFKTMQQAEENEATKLEKMLDTCRRARFDCLVILGGNGTHKTANLLSEHGIPVVTLPKTIDNDLWGTQVTFGFQSAMNIAVEVIDSIHSTAFSHSRVFIVEIMGHKAGWHCMRALPPARTSSLSRRSPMTRGPLRLPSSSAPAGASASPSSRWRRAPSAARRLP